MQRKTKPAPRARDDERIDWARIELEYRAGQLSNREIARNFGVSETAIRKRAKGDEKRPRWIKDLAPLVQAETQRRILESDTSPEPPIAGEAVKPAREPTTREIVDAAATRAADVVLAHRTHIVGLRRRVEHLAIAYDNLAEALTAEQDQAPQAKDKKAAFAGLANGLEQLVVVSSSLITLERQAFGLDRPDADKPNAAQFTQDQRAAALRAVRARMAATETGASA
jgi:predicted transcriptional regulator